MNTFKSKLAAVVIPLSLTFVLAAAQPPGDKKPEAAGPPPAVVVTGTVGETVIAPDGEFLGTLYYNVESEIASEVNGIVSEIFIEAGQRVKEGDVMARLNDDLLQEDLRIAEATQREFEAAFEKAKTDLARSEKLFAENSVSEQTLDDDRFAVITREWLVTAQKARIAKIKTELAKKEIRAPYAGAVLAKMTDMGAWVGEGDRIASIARTDEIDLTANVPQSIVPFVKVGADVPVTVNKQPHTGRVFAIVARGDIATRTFPVRIRLQNPDGALFESMEGFVRLPAGEPVTCLEVPRDAILRQQSGPVVFAVENGMAVMHAIEIVGYSGDSVGVRSPELKAGMIIVTKGNERLRPGQALAPRESLEPAAAPPAAASDGKES